MDWERKFYDIVRETESNLASARRKLQSHDSSKHSPRFEDSEPSEPTYQPSTWMSYVNNNDHINSIRRQMGLSEPCTSQSQGMDPVSSSLQSSMLTNQLKELHSKMDLQSQMIENLQEFVRTLNREKNEYHQQIRDLQSELATLSKRVPEQGSGLDPPGLKRQVDFAPSDVQQPQTSLGPSGSISPLQTQQRHYSASLERSFKDMQKSVHTELEELRRDFNSMIHRVGRLELDVSSHGTSHREDLPRRPGQEQGRAYSSSAGHSDYTSTFLGQNVSPLTPGDVFKVKEFRNTMSQLHNKLDCLEGRVSLSKSTIPPLSSLTDKAQERPSTSSFRPNVKDFADDDNDSDVDPLDVSDEFDLDLPMDDERLSDDALDAIGDVAKAGRGRRISLSPDIDAMFGDDFLNDELESVAGLGSATGVGSKVSSSRSLRATQSKKKKKKKKASMSEQQQDQLVDEMLSDLDLDSTADPYDLDSLDELSGDLKLDDLRE